MIVKSIGKTDYPSYYEDAIRHYMSRLLHDNRIRSITIEYLDDLLNDWEVEAYIKVSSWFYKPKNFTVVLDSGLTQKEKLRALAHESVHIKQYACGQLYEFGDYTMWKRKLYRKTIDSTYDEYIEFPWEKEAFSYESVLIGSYLRQNMGDLEQTFDITNNL